MDVDEDYDMETTSGDDAVDDDGQPTVSAHTGQLTARYKKLGFHPQKEIYCNRYLPYADLLDDESQRMLDDVKVLMATAISHREMTPTIATAVTRLMV